MTDIFELFNKIGSSPSQAKAPITHIIAGLGNPGTEYERTRHNTGFFCLDAIARAEGVRVTTAKFSSLSGDAVIGGVRTLLLKPQTYMNLSGEAVKAAADFYKIPPENIIVICDDVNFDTGFVRIRRRGSHGGHNGLRNIEECLGSSDYIRIKVGVGRKPTPEYDLAAWVLGKYSDGDMKTLSAAADNVRAAAELLLCGKTDEAMNKYSR